MTASNQPIYEFHVSRKARDRYGFDESLFGFAGNVIFANFHAVRRFTARINEKRDLVRFPEQAVRAGQINAMGLIDEILHLVIGLYKKTVSPNAIWDAIKRLETVLGKEKVDHALAGFVEMFPPVSVYRGGDAAEYLRGQTGGGSNREVVLEEMALLWLANVNPAFLPYSELFDDDELEHDTVYPAIIAELRDFFHDQPPFGPDNQSILDMLRSPALAYPHSLPGQLEYIRQRWGFLLGDRLFRLLSGLDLIREEEKAVFAGQGPGPSRVYDYSRLISEPERFSRDRDWMGRLVLIAKNTYVWLDQLSKTFGKRISRLDEIPDEELELLARRGFTGLWLIGLWERSKASQTIKQLCGNPEAAPSAYSLSDYRIADALGGEAALWNLKERAAARGIRLASDMVPNHMGIDSKWVIEHPDWFVSLNEPPFPNYSFNGRDLSSDDRVGIWIEDQYYSRSDAAVVFKRLDRWTGDARYIYHGNDGTSMPWNDTAQLNYLRADLREAVIQTILHVARQFPIIRFDAAMTLAKKHFQRLWFPEPGHGGAIPSRAGMGLTREQFDTAMPVEFWREVVDRVAAEIPDTLLLAEAFWMMEGYFVRTLGMHRVYNSAFMNMLRDEENGKYRQVIKNTLEFDPEILKRFVNFMNNPDERTAVDQFDKGDKYFGICTLMATLPGLPMFGHGQIEGFTEKYGMEYFRAYWDEKPDANLVARHEREIFPLLWRRPLFSGVDGFLLYDLVDPEGFTHEDVFAYSNRADGEAALVVYHNKFARAKGRIRESAAFSRKTDDGKRLERKTISQGLGFSADENAFIKFRDHITGLEYIRSCGEISESGLWLELEAYQCHVFWDFRELRDDSTHRYRQLTDYLAGSGVPNLDDALRAVFLEPVHSAFRNLVNADLLKRLASQETGLEKEELSERYEGLAWRIRERTGGDAAIDALTADMIVGLSSVLNLWNSKQLENLPPRSFPKKLGTWIEKEPMAKPVLIVWALLHDLGRIAGEADAIGCCLSWMDEWQFGRMIETALRDLGLNESAAQEAEQLIKCLIRFHDWLDGEKDFTSAGLAEALFGDPVSQAYFRVNRHREILWFHKESFENLMLALTALVVADGIKMDASQDRMRRSLAILRKLEAAAKSSGYQVEKLISIIAE